MILFFFGYLLNLQLTNLFLTFIFSFLICVQRLLVERCFEPPQRLTLQQENLRLLTHNIYSSQISLAHKAELAATLEFPELRLIEYDCGKKIF